MGAVVNRNKISHQQYAILILREDYKFTFDEIGKKLTLSPSWCHRLYENALANEKTYGKVYDLFWI